MARMGPLDISLGALCSLNRCVTGSFLISFLRILWHSLPFADGFVVANMQFHRQLRYVPVVVSLAGKSMEQNATAAAASPKHSSLQRTGKGNTNSEFRFDTRMVLGGKVSQEWTTDPLGRSIVNPPVWHASTVTFPTVEALEQSRKTGGLHYGRYGTPTSWALEDAFSELEGADNSLAVSSGLSAITTSLLAFLKAGDHLLVSDGVYEPTRSFCDRFLSRFGCKTDYFDPCIASEDLERLFCENTRLVFLENPSSLTFELHDFQALAALAKSRGASVLVDNTYGPGIFSPLRLGADVSINAATKYIGGHSDLMLGLIACRDHQAYRKVSGRARELGCCAAPDDCYLALRGMRTLHLRMKRHGESGLAVARWLEGRPEVGRVMHPGLASHPQHHVWQRDFSGASGLLSVQLRDCFDKAAVTRMLEGCRLWSMGYSWGGFESLILPVDPAPVRSAVPWSYGGGLGRVVRLHVGLEDVEDLLADLAAALARLH